MNWQMHKYDCNTWRTGTRSPIGSIKVPVKLTDIVAYVLIITAYLVGVERWDIIRPIHYSTTFSAKSFL